MSDVVIPVESFEITDEIMEKAITYMPFLEKSVWVKDNAEKCLKDVVIENGAVTTSVKGEDLIQKSVLLLSTLISYYLGVEIKTDDLEENPFTLYQIYDYYASGNPSGQLEKYKRNERYSEKAYAILQDYKELKRLLDTEIYNLRNAHNDIFAKIEALASLIPQENAETETATEKEVSNEQ